MLNQRDGCIEMHTRYVRSLAARTERKNRRPDAAATIGSLLAICMIFSTITCDREYRVPTPAVRTVFYAAPNGSGTTCTQDVPCSITQAQRSVRAALPPRSADPVDVMVILADGVYRLSAPLSLDGSDSGMPGHPVVWEAGVGAHPRLSAILGNCANCFQ